MVVFAGSFLFTYPDILTAPVEIISTNAPAAVIAKTSGNLTSIFVSDSQLVKTHEVLGMIKNPAVLNQVLWLRKELERIKPGGQLSDTGWIQHLPDTLQLGEIQNTYAAFIKGGQDYLQFKRLRALEQKISSLQQKKIQVQRSIEITKTQMELKKQDFKLSMNQFQRDSQLYTKQVLSMVDYEKSKKELIQQRLAFEDMRSAEVNGRIQMQELDQQIIDYQLESLNQEKQYRNQLQELSQNMESSIASWFDTYVLVAPMDGIVAFNKVWSQNQFVQAGDEVFTILPEQRNQIIGRVTLPAKGSGKVKPGQTVNLKFESFPYQQFGMIIAHVSTVSLVPAGQNYTVEINLPDSLITNYGYVLPFSQKMPATAEIITENLPLVVRLFNPLKSLIRAHWHGENFEPEKVKRMPVAPNSVSKVPVKKESSTDSVSTKAELNKTPEKIYSIIGGSYTNQKTAQVDLKSYLQKGYHAELIPSGDKIRISLESLTDRSKAIKELERIRDAENNPSIWVMVAEPDQP